MPDEFDPEDFVGLEPAMVTLKRSDVRRWEKAGQERDKAVAEAAAAKRELAILRAGLPDTPMAKYFAKGYDGDLDVDSIREAAVEAGILTGSPTQQAQTAASLAGHTQAVAAQTGAGVPGGEDLMAKLRTAKNADEVRALRDQYLRDTEGTVNPNDLLEHMSLNQGF